MSIGEVFRTHQCWFPEVRASKVRFLEERGLITPARTAAGYRKYTQADVDRLRFILALQRDQFLPLKLSKTTLTPLTPGSALNRYPVDYGEPRSVSQQLAHEISGHIRPMTRAELQGICGASDELMKHSNHTV